MQSFKLKLIEQKYRVFAEEIYFEKFENFEKKFQEFRNQS